MLSIDFIFAKKYTHIFELNEIKQIYIVQVYK